MSLVKLFAEHAEEPNPANVYRILEKYEKSAYGIEDKIQSLILGSGKWDQAKILLTCITINELFSTGIIRINDIAGHISNNATQIHKLIENGDAKAVDMIARGHGIKHIKTKIEGKEQEYNFYSFATKYCSFINPVAFPIYDRYVAAMLRAYNERRHFSDFKEQDLKNYAKFREAVEAFMAEFKLNELTFREIDKFLWYHGKSIALEYKEKITQQERTNV